MRIFILIILILFSGVCFGQFDMSKAKDLSKMKLTWPSSQNLTESVGEIKIDLTNADDFYHPVTFDTTKTPKVDSMDMKVISMNEFKTYMERIDLAVKKQFDLTEVQKYEQIIRVMNSIYAEADKKRRMK